MANTESLYGKEKRQNKKNRIASAVLFVLIAVLLLVVVMNVFVYITVEVDGVSMYPTLNDMDVVKANKHKDFSYGDIVVIEKTEGNEKYNIVKRVIAMGGDHLEIKDYKVYLNGEVLTEDYVKDDPATELVDESRTYGDIDLIVPDGKIFYLGDNRINSIDSRDDGCCDEKDVIGVIEGWSISTRGIRNFFYDLLFR